MARLNYETADTLVYDPVAAHRTATRAVLFTLGFRNIETVGTVEAFSEAIRKRSPDLALCEARGADAELCEMIQSLRQGTGGHDNPFLVIIVTAWEKTNTLVGRVLNSGADDLVLRPFSTTLLRTRIDTLAERRKRFVITHDYVGPDRRVETERTGEVELFEPPNSLKMKAKDGLSLEEVSSRLGEQLKSARSTLNTGKLRRDAFQIGILWRLLQERDAPGYDHHLAKLAKMTQAVAKRCRDTEFEPGVQLCESIQAAVTGLESEDGNTASIQLLGKSALQLIQVLDPEKGAEAQLRAIETTAEMIRSRQKSQAPLAPTSVSA